METFSPFGGLTDEELVWLVKSAEAPEAMEVLIVRHRARLERLLGFLARRRNLTPEDRPDAHQQAFFILHEAVRGFDPDHTCAAQEHPFAAFLAQVARMRFADFARRLHGERKRLGHSLEEGPPLDSQAFQLPGLVGSAKTSSRFGQDPALLAQVKEEEERLEAAVQRLSPRQRRVWDALSQGASRQMIAEEFGVSYAVAMHWRQEVITILRAAVKEKGD